MSAKRLVDLALDNGLIPDSFSGKTPWQTMKAKLSVDIRRKGSFSRFVRTAPGRFYLRALLKDPSTEYHAVPLRPPPPSEDVVVIPSSLLEEYGRFQGISSDPHRLLRFLTDSGQIKTMPRMAAEQDDDHKQLLTYVLVLRKGSVLAFKRGTFSRVEDFLKGSECIGFGGHVKATDKALFSSGFPGILECAERELAEEIRLPRADRDRLVARQELEIVGALNDDSSAVGRRHLAIVLKYEVKDSPEWDRVERREKSVTQLRWLEPASGSWKLSQFEYWSQLCFLHFFPDVATEQPSFIIRPKHRKRLRPPNPICVVGPIGSGKTEATCLLREEFGYVEVNSGQVLAGLLGMPPVTEANRSAFQDAAYEFISSTAGPQLLAAAVFDELSKTNSKRVLIDGIRQRQTLDVLASLMGSMPGLIYVHTPPHVAFEFYRLRSNTNPTIHDFLKVRDSLVEADAQSFLKIANAILYNWTGKNDYKKAVRQMMRAILDSDT